LFRSLKASRCAPPTARAVNTGRKVLLLLLPHVPGQVRASRVLAPNYFDFRPVTERMFVADRVNGSTPGQAHPVLANFAFAKHVKVNHSARLELLDPEI